MNRIFSNFRAIYLSSLFLLLAWMFCVFSPQMSLELTPRGGDNGQYYLRALALAEGRGYVALESASPDGTGSGFDAFTPPPLVPIIMAAGMVLFGHSLAVAKVIFFIFELASILGLLFFLCWFVRPIEAILIVATFCFSWLVAMYIFPVINTDVPFCGISIMLLATLYQLKQKNNLNSFHWLLLGIGFGLLVWLKYGSVFWLAGVVVWMLWKTWKPEYPSSDRWLPFVWLVLGMAITVGILFAWIYHQAPDFFYAYKTHHATDRISGFALHGFSAWSSRIVDGIKFYWGGADITIAAQRYFGWFGYVTSLSFYVVVLIGIFSTKKPGAGSLIFIVALAHIFPYLLSSSQDYRYLLPLIILLWIPAVWGLRTIGKGIQKSINLPTRLSLSHIVLLTNLLLFGYSAIRWVEPIVRYGRDIKYTDTEQDFREICDWTKDRYPLDTILISDRAALHKLWTGYSTIYLSRSEAQRPDFYLPIYTQRIVSFNKVLIIHNDKKVSSPHQKFFQMWIDKNIKYVREIYEVGDFKLFEVDIPNLCNRIIQENL